jgi:hypothetical protein
MKRSRDSRSVVLIPGGDCGRLVVDSMLCMQHLQRVEVQRGRSGDELLEILGLGRLTVTTNGALGEGVVDVLDLALFAILVLDRLDAGVMVKRQSLRKGFDRVGQHGGRDCNGHQRTTGEGVVP